MAKYGMGLTLAAIVGVLLFCAGCVYPFEAVFYLILGWGFFLARVLPQITMSADGILTGVIGLVGFVLGLHLLLRWFAGTQDRPWQWRWTCGLAALVVVMFAAGIGTVGSLHQVGWLVTSPRPLLEGGIRRRLSARDNSAKHLMDMTVGMYHYNKEKQSLPPGYTADRNGQPLHGWQAALLPYIDKSSFYVIIHFDRPWDAPENRPAMQATIPEFLYRDQPFPERDNGYGLSHYAGNSRVLTPRVGPRVPADIPDGTSNTLLLGEVTAGFRPWGHPLNLRDPARGIRPSADAFAGPWPEGITQFVLVDGSVRSVRNTASPAVLKALATPAGGEPITEWPD
jgi:hypothetical protein